MTTNNSEQKYLKTTSVTERYGVTDETINRWINSDGFPRPIRVGGHKLWKIDDLESWEANKHEVGNDSNNQV